MCVFFIKKELLFSKIILFKKTNISTAKPNYTLADLIKYFLKLGTTGFGGPVALVGYMHRDLVEHKKWIDDSDFKEGLALPQLAPGPLAAQLGIYIGYIHFGILGATVSGIAFVLPSFIMVLLLGIAYKAFGGLPWMQAVFYGVSASRETTSFFIFIRIPLENRAPNIQY